MGPTAQSFTFVVKYRRGNSNIADPLSRLVAPGVPEEFDAENKFMVLAVLESAAIDVQELEESASRDPVLNSVKRSLQTGNWNEPDVKPYVPFSNELGMVGDTIVRGNKLVVPASLRERMLDLAHEGHPGSQL